MNRAIPLWRAVLCGVLLSANGAGVWAQAQKFVAPSRVVETVDDTKTVTLSGNVHPLARTAYDQGALPDSQPMTRMLLLLQRSSAQEQSLRQLIDAQQTKNSGNYHAWLTPEQFGQQFGPADSDVQAVTDWLTRSGFQVANVAKGKGVIEFSGNVGQVRSAFHTQVHKFVVNGEEHFANVSDPAIPAALAPVVAGVAALHNFQKYPSIVKSGTYRRYKGSNQLQPLFTFGNPALYAVGPGDFAKIYNIPPTATGTGQSIAVIAQTNINTQDVVNFRSMFGLPAYSSVCTSALPPTCQFSVIVNGPDPGIVGPGTATDDEIESDLDSQWAGAIAPGANLNLIVSESTLSNPTQVSQGVDLSALYAVDNNISPVISDSYGNCEAALGTAGNQFYNSLWQQAAAQGITVAVAAGDDGSAGCDPIQSIDPDAATQGIAVNGLASTPYNVAVGGTDFDPSTTANATYWNTTSDTVNSALGYIPEITWDNSNCAQIYPAPCSAIDTSSYAADITGGSGGPSNCITSTTNNSGVTTCTKTNNVYGYPKPSYQAALTPADSVRDIPDVSFFASNGGPLANGTDVTYVICQSDTNPQGSTTPTGASCNLNTPYADFTLVGGTSASTPAFAAVMALVNQSTGQRQGNANYVLYNLASSDSNYTGGACVTSNGTTPQLPNAACVFHDINKGNNTMACDSGTANCSNQTAFGSGQFGVLVCNTATNSNTPAWQTCPLADNGVPAFQSSTKYDLATGLGSINVGNLLTKWTSAIRTATTTNITPASSGSPSGSKFTATVTVSPAPPSGEAVSLVALGSGGAVLGSYGPFSLSAGSASVSTNLLPPGTTNVEGSYGGDATLAASTSSSVALSGTVAGANLPSTLTVYFVSLSTGGISTGAQNFAYGSTGYILRIVVTGSNSSAGCSFAYPNTKPAIPCPTGTVSLFDNGTPLNDFLNNGTQTNVGALNNQGFAEDQPINVNGGTHKITATYSGDGNYAATSNSNSLSITITQVATQTAVASSLSSITSGSSVVLTAVVSTTSGGNPPTGSVTFNSSTGGSLGAPTCVGTPASGNTGAYCTAILTTTISALYPPPTGDPGAPNFPRIPTLIALLSLILFALGMRWIPQTRRRAYAYLGLIAIALMVGVVAGCGGGSGGGGGAGTRTITAAYPGDANYTKSSGTVTITVQ
ncbi:MAG TPA: protease pro-enzyme activation domain-containing protein [Candidatus Acidoferrales bacterium]|nr:protease pro-enzyme activation domain-containing protein [Candidatus Acidoferrales bacterium]